MTSGAASIDPFHSAHARGVCALTPSPHRTPEAVPRKSSFVLLIDYGIWRGRERSAHPAAGQRCAYFRVSTPVRVLYCALRIQLKPEPDCDNEKKSKSPYLRSPASFSFVHPL